MDITYIEKSHFLGPCEQGIRQHMALLSTGQPIRINFDPEKSGNAGSIVVEIRSDNGRLFGSDYESADLTRFTARIRAAATALYNCDCSGRFRITHREGTLEIIHV